MRSRLIANFVLILLTALLAVLCLGQTQTARLQGIVHDAGGANVPGAKVVAVNTLTPASGGTPSNASRDNHAGPALGLVGQGD